MAQIPGHFKCSPASNVAFHTHFITSESEKSLAVSRPECAPWPVGGAVSLCYKIPSIFWEVVGLKGDSSPFD